MATAVVWHVNLEGRQAIPEVQLYVLVDAKTEILIYSFFFKKTVPQVESIRCEGQPIPRLRINIAKITAHNPNVVRRNTNPLASPCSTAPDRRGCACC